MQRHSNSMPRKDYKTHVPTHSKNSVAFMPMASFSSSTPIVTCGSISSPTSASVATLKLVTTRGRLSVPTGENPLAIANVIAITTDKLKIVRQIVDIIAYGGTKPFYRVLDKVLLLLMQQTSLFAIFVKISRLGNTHRFFSLFVLIEFYGIVKMCLESSIPVQKNHHHLHLIFNHDYVKKQSRNEIQKASTWNFSWSTGGFVSFFLSQPRMRAIEFLDQY